MTTQLLTDVYTVYGLAKALHTVISNLRENDEYENVSEALEDNGSLSAISDIMYKLVTNGHLTKIEDALDEHLGYQEQFKEPPTYNDE